MRIADYEVVSVIAQTELSTLYLVEHVQMHTRWALKKLIKQSSVSFALFGEAELLKNLSHPALPRIMDVFDTPKAYYIVEEYIEGRDLRAFLKQKKTVEEKILLDWFRTLCDALRYLHRQEPPIIHRDIKPANIMMLEDGSLKLIDFGISKEYHEEEVKDSLVAGTVGYAAPEQLTNQKTDARTDIYSLGVTMYQLLTGEKAEGNPPVFPPARKYDTNISLGMERILNRCLQVKPDDRYQTAEELLDDLIHIDKYDEPLRKVQAARKKRKRMVLAAAGLGIVLLAGGSALHVQYIKQQKYEAARQEELRLEKLYQEGLNDISAGKGMEAKDIFTELLGNDADNPEYLLSLGDTWVLLAKNAVTYDEKIADLDEAEELYNKGAAEDDSLKTKRLKELDTLREEFKNEQDQTDLLQKIINAFAYDDMDSVLSAITENKDTYDALLDSCLSGTKVWQDENGKYLQVNNDGHIYYGDMEDGIRAGQGKWIRYDEDQVFVYHGAWDKDLPNGKGKYHEYKDRTQIVEAQAEADVPYEVTYEGNFVNGSPEGECLFVWYMLSGSDRNFTIHVTDGTPEAIDESTYIEFMNDAYPEYKDKESFKEQLRETYAGLQEDTEIMSQKGFYLIGFSTTTYDDGSKGYATASWKKGDKLIVDGFK